MKETQRKHNTLKGYARYSSLALQMGVIITLGTLGGLKLDKLINLKFPVFTLILSLVSVAIAIYLALKDLLKKK
jgi:hypothetical protein